MSDSNKPLVVDFHCHILPRDWPNLAERYGYGGFVQLEHTEEAKATGKCCSANMTIDGTFFRAVAPNCFDVESRLADMDRDGVDVQVLSTVPIMFSYWAKPEDCLDLSKLLNDHLAETVAKQPNRFVALATVPMSAPALATKELERVAEMGFKGIMIATHIDGVDGEDPAAVWNLDNEELLGFWQRVEELGMCVFVHPWDMMGKARMPRHWLPWLVGMPAETSLAISSLMLGGIFKRFPGIKFCFAHGGGSFPGTFARIEHGWKCRPDLCDTGLQGDHPRDYLKHVYVDSLVHDVATLKFVCDLLGTDHVLLGTDYPFPLGEVMPFKPPGGVIRKSDFSDAEKADMLGLNAMKMLGLDPDKFRRTSK